MISQAYTTKLHYLAGHNKIPNVAHTLALYVEEYDKKCFQLLQTESENDAQTLVTLRATP